MSNTYKEKTYELINLIHSKKSLNSMKHFFAQLSALEQLDVFPIVNAISDNKTDYNKLVVHSIKKEPWIEKISLSDIRNVIVFYLWKEHKIMVDKSEKYINPDKQNVNYILLLQKNTTGLYSDHLLNLFHICFYVRQISIIKSSSELDELWNRFGIFIKSYYEKHGLVQITSFFFDLIEPILH